MAAIEAGSLSSSETAKPELDEVGRHESGCLCVIVVGARTTLGLVFLLWLTMTSMSNPSLLSLRGRKKLFFSYPVQDRPDWVSGPIPRMKHHAPFMQALS